MKHNLPAMLTTALVALTAFATPASAWGFCIGICAEAGTDAEVKTDITPETITWTATNSNVQTQACVGNIVVQIGLSNHLEMCNNNSTVAQCNAGYQNSGCDSASVEGGDFGEVFKVVVEGPTLASTKDLVGTEAGDFLYY